jgi:membrane associated rhomboid family serine protease
VATCYRHPDRATGVSCSNCGRPICPDCMTSTSVGMRCPECARQKTRVVRRGYAPSEPVLTYGLIAMNVLVYIGSVLTGSSVAGGGFGGSQVIVDGGLSRAAIHDGELWRLITSGFLHAGFFHLLFNMYALYILGQLLEPAVGKLRFGLIYFVSLLAGSFGALIAQPHGLTVGASGAIFGLMGAAVVVARRSGLGLMESGLGIWLGLNLLITFTIPGISIGGHIGGLIGGALAALVLVELPARLRLPDAAATMLCAALGALAVAGSIVVAG